MGRFREADDRQHLGESKQLLAHRWEDSDRSFDAGQSFGSEVAYIRAGGFSQGMGWALAAGDGQAGVSDLSGRGQTEVEGQAEETLPAVAQAGPQGGRLTNGELSHLEEGLSMDSLPPTRRELLKRVLSQIRRDIADAKRVVEYAHDRVFHEKKLPSTQKVLSLSDGSAAYIKKGSRNPVIGYKPQLVRSENGFVTSLIVPQGNAADSIELAPAIGDSIKRTGVISELISTDDGYASAKGRKEVLGMGVKQISISGAKGKKLSTPEDREREAYREARRNRSAVESADVHD